MEVLSPRSELCGIYLDIKNGASQTIPESGTVGQEQALRSKTMEEDPCQPRRYFSYSDANIRAGESQPW